MNSEPENSNSKSLTPAQLAKGLLDLVSDLAWSLSLDDIRILSLNPAAETAYGRSLAELAGHPARWLECVHSEDRVVLSNNLQRLAELKEKDFAQKFRIVTTDGANVWVKG